MRAEGIDNVNVELMAERPEYPRYQMANKAYEFKSLQNDEYEITPSKNDDYRNGVSTLDLVLIQRHILGIAKLTDAEKLIAADVNKDGKVTASDLVELRRLILGVTEKFDNNGSWRFVPQAYQLDITNPYAAPSSIKVNLTSDKMDADFRGIKIGDINVDAVVNVRGNVEPRSNKAIKLGLEDREVKAGEVIEIPVRASDFNKVYGFQFTVNAAMEVMGMSSGAIELDGNNYASLKNNNLTISWSSEEVVSAREGEVLFTISMKAKTNGKLSEMIKLTSDVAKAEAYTGQDMEAAKIEVNYNNAQGSETYSLRQNEPNPFRDETTIKYEVPQAGKVKFTVYDVSGKIMTVKNVDAAKGMNTLRLTRNEVKTIGMAYYTMEAGDFKATRHMIVVE
jgi:hypothetical protein